MKYIINKFENFWIIMNVEDFWKYGCKMVDYIVDYLENIWECEVVYKVIFGYFKKRFLDEVFENLEDFEEVFKDIEKFIMFGVRNLNNL